MPKSKRAKVVHLSKTTKKGKQLTLKLYANIQECIPKYRYIYVFAVDNMRNNYLKDVRTQLSNSRLFFGKTKVMAAALGSTGSTSPHPHTHLLTPHLHGTVGLLFSLHPPAHILSHLSNFHPSSFARAGTIAPRSFTLPPGPLYSRGGEIPIEEDVPLGHGVEPNLRKLGVPTRLERGKVVLEREFVVCKEGECLGSGQTTLLKMFGVAVAEFRVEVRAWLDREEGVVEAVEGGGERMDVVEAEAEVEVEDDHEDGEE